MPDEATIATRTKTADKVTSNNSVVRNILFIYFLFFHCVINLGGNVLLFIPIGWFLPALWYRLEKFLPFLLICILAISLVEVTQLLTLLGFLDVDDLILNVLGMAVGYGLYRLFSKRGKL